MLLSMALVAVVVLTLFWFVAWQRPEVQGPIRPEVDVTQVFADFRVTEPFPVLEPTGLGNDWSANSAWFEPADVTGDIGGALLHVGYVTPAGSYAEVSQTDGSSKAAVAEWVDGAERIDSVNIAGRDWAVVESPESGKQALVTTIDKETTIVVTGKANLDELEDLASSLR
ncbi:MAG: DUF4245 domain-containing protein [Actinomycetes bacterium]